MPKYTQKIGEQEHHYLVLKKFKGLNSQPSREALPEEEFAWIENLMPIGDAFMQVVPQVGSSIATYGSSLAFMKSATLGTVNYQIGFTSAGGAEAINLGTSATITICAGGTLSGTPAMDQWKSERIIIADSVGMYSWDGTLFYSPGSLATISVTTSGTAYTSTPTVSFSGGGGTGATAVATLSGGGISAINITAVGSGFTSAPTVSFTGGTTATTGLATASAFIMPTGMGGTAIAVYSGRVWAFNGRLISYTAPNTWYDVATADAAGSSSITEGALREKVYAAVALDNYLYVFGDSSVIIIGDLKVTGSVTTFSQTFLSSTTGTTLPNTIVAMERAVLFMNKYGVYALFGASVQKISDALDGIFPKIDFTQAVSAGLAQIYNILCYVVNFVYQDTNTNRALQAVFFKGKWFLTSQGNNLTLLSPAIVSGVQQLWGTTGTDLVQLYSNTTATIATTLTTGLFDFGNPIFDKQIVRGGVEWTAAADDAITMEVDTEVLTESANSTANASIIWYNNAGAQISWTNSSTATLTWLSSGFLLSDSAFDVTGKYLGAKLTSNNAGFVINGILMEYVQRAPWSR